MFIAAIWTALLAAARSSASPCCSSPRSSSAASTRRSIQRFQVRPSREVPRAALHPAQHQGDAGGVRHRGRRDQELQRRRPTATQGQLRDDAETIPGIRLLDPIVVSPTFKQLQSVKSYYAVPRRPRRRPLHRRRQGPRHRARRPRARPRRHPGQPAQLAQRPHRLHPRLRPRRGLRQPAHRRRRAGLLRAQHPPGRRAAATSSRGSTSASSRRLLHRRRGRRAAARASSTTPTTAPAGQKNSTYTGKGGVAARARCRASWPTR